MENKALRGTVADLERVKRAFGPEQVEAAVEATEQREAGREGQKQKERCNFLLKIGCPILCHLIL